MDPVKRKESGFHSGKNASAVYKTVLCRSWKVRDSLRSVRLS